MRVEERSPPSCLFRDKIIFRHDRESEDLLLLSSYAHRRVHIGETEGDHTKKSRCTREVGRDGKRERGRRDFSLSRAKETTWKIGDERDRERASG